MKLVADMRKWIPVVAFGLSTLWTVGSTGDSGITATLVPNEIHPGDMFRLEVVRQNEEFAVFKLEVPPIDRLHLLGTEKSPVELVDGSYLQKESWIFQPDSSGDITMENLSVVFVHSDPEVRIFLPELKLSVIPYPSADSDNSPLPMASLPKSKNSSKFGVYFFITLIAIIPLLYIYFRYRRNRAIQTESISDTLLTEVLAELEKGNINSDQLHWLLDAEKNSLSEDLKKEIELAIYANRGDPQILADSLKKEVLR